MCPFISFFISFEEMAFFLLETGRNRPGVSNAIRRRSGGGADGQAPSEDTPSGNKTRWIAFSVFLMSYVETR